MIIGTEERMKKISIVHAVLFLLLVTKMSYSYVSNDIAYELELKNKKINLDKIIKNIQKEYTEINSKNNFYTAKKIDIYEESTEGAEVTGYYLNGDLKKIVGWYYGETGKAIAEYYYHDDKFFFVYSKTFNYEPPKDEPYTWNRDKIISVKENRYYFYNGNLIRWISGKKIIEPDSEEFVVCGNEFTKKLEKYSDIFINNNDKSG
jgi:hypothetical protein